MGSFYEFFAGGGMARAGLGEDWTCLFANDFDPKKGDAYRACGRVMRASVQGDRPMSIVWSLEVPLPARLFREFSVLRGA